MTEFCGLLADLVRRYGGTKQALAQAVGVRPSTISHLLSGQSVPGTEVCLRLATVTGVSASTILRAANKGAIADLIEGLYGMAAERRQAFSGSVRLTPSDLEYLDYLRMLSPREHRAVLLIVKAAAAARPPQLGRALSFPDVSTK